MTLLNFEGFDHVSGVSDLFAGILSGASASSNASVTLSPNTQFGGKSLCVTTTSPSSAVSASYANIYVPAVSNTIVVGAFIALSSQAKCGSDIAITNGTVGHIFCRFILNQVFVYRGDPVAGSYVLLGSANTGLVSAGWGYIEIEATIATGTSGAVSVYVNTTNIISLTGINTSNDTTTTILGIALGAYDGMGSGFASYFDDIYALDLSGSAPNNTLLGPVRVLTRYPSGDTITLFTPSTGSANWKNISETNMDGDATYNASHVSSGGDFEVFTATGIPTTSTQVFAVQVKAAVRKDDSGDRAMATIVTSNGVPSTGASVALSPTYKYINDIYNIDPNTGTSWSVSGVNSSQFGYIITG